MFQNAVRAVKFPRTPHLPFSEGVHDDDRLLESMGALLSHEVVVTEKMDGENTTMYRGHIHARSLDGRSHPSRDWVKQFWSGFKDRIPVGFRVCGENLFARHSVSYHLLPSYFLGFSVWNDGNVCLSWDETIEWFELLGITPVPELRRGFVTEKELRTMALTGIERDTCEGFVVRVAGQFAYGEYQTMVAKWVRKGHVQTDRHWMRARPIVRNGLARGAAG